MDTQKHVDYWLKGAEDNLKAAEDMFKNGHYDWCLFIGHLILEKVLKAYYVKIVNSTPPKTHNLAFLAEEAKLKITKEQGSFLFDVNTFNIETRYSDYKSDFYQKCTKEFVSENFTKIKEMYEWIKKQI